MGIKEVFKKKSANAKVEEIDAGVIDTSVETKEQNLKPTDKVILEITLEELMLLGKALETSENTQLFYRVQEGADNNNLLAKLVEKMPKDEKTTKDNK